MRSATVPDFNSISNSQIAVDRAPALIVPISSATSTHAPTNSPASHSGSTFAFAFAFASPMRSVRAVRTISMRKRSIKTGSCLRFAGPLIAACNAAPAAVPSCSVRSNSGELRPRGTLCSSRRNELVVNPLAVCTQRLPSLRKRIESPCAASQSSAVS